MEPTRILLVEDDHFTSQFVEEGLISEYPSCAVICLKTEQELHTILDGYEASPPDVCLLDMRLPWQRPNLHMTRPPQEVVEGGYAQAGVRCHRQIRQRLGPQIPIIFYTALRVRDSVPEDVRMNSNTYFVEKIRDIGPLIEQLRAILVQ